MVILEAKKITKSKFMQTSISKSVQEVLEHSIYIYRRRDIYSYVMARFSLIVQNLQASGAITSFTQKR